jgi:hypothetical protein
VSDSDWGVGDKADAKAFATAYMRGGQKIELITGEHPHSRQDNSHYARFPGGRIEDFSGHYTSIRVEVETYNYMKESEVSGDEVRKGGGYKIMFNGRTVADGFGREIEHMLHTVERRITELLEHPLRPGRDGWEEEAIGRKVYWNHVPAIIQRVTSDGDLILVPEGDVDFWMPYWDEGYEEYRRSMKTELTSPSVWWYRT